MTEIIIPRESSVFNSPYIDYSDCCEEVALFKLKKVYHVTGHVLERFMERSQRTKTLREIKGIDIPERALKAMFRQFRSSIKVERTGNRLTQLLNHGCNPAEYFFNQNLLYVVERDFLMTCYQKGRDDMINYSFMKDIIHP